MDAGTRSTRPTSWSGQLAELLRARRAGLLPADVGLPAGARRRTPGLRREEVAQLAGISTTYYTFLEQGRDVHPSRQVLDALATALALGPVDRAHLHALAETAATPVAAGAERVAPAVAALVDRLDPDPTYVSGRCWDVLHANRAARLLWADWPAVPAADRNILWWTLADPAAREVLVPWEREARAQLARFRAAAARHPGDAGFAHLVERLHQVSPQVRRWWPRHEVAPLASGTKSLRHPALGVVAFRHVVLQVADHPGQKVVTFAPADPADRARLAGLLA